MIDYQVNNQQVAVLTWNMQDRPVNVMNDDSLGLFAELIERAIADGAVKGLVIASAKRDFVTGADLVSFLSDRRPHVIFEKGRITQTLLRRLETCGKPVCAALNGTALGGGLEIALACHHRVVADLPGVRLGLPEVTLGLLPGAGGTQRLPRLIGLKAAVPLLLEGTHLNVAQALKLGIVDEVVPQDAVLAAATAWVAAQVGPVQQPWDRKGFQLPGEVLTPMAIYNIFAIQTAGITARTHDNLPAPRHILSAVFEGCTSDMETGLKAELRHFVSCVCSAESKNIIRTSFFGVADAAKLKRRPAGVPTMALETVGVTGQGPAALAVARAAAGAGLGVVLPQGQALKEALTAVLQHELASGKLTEDQAAAIGVRIVAAPGWEALAGCPFVLVAAEEGRAVSSEALARVEAAVAPEAVIAVTATDSLPALAATSRRPQGLLGLRWPLAIPGARLAEVARGAQTADAAVAHAMDFVKRLGKVPLVMTDVGGTYVQRVLRAFTDEGRAMAGEGVSPVLIDNLARHAGMPEGPIRMTGADDVAGNLVSGVPQPAGAAEALLKQRLLYAQAIEAVRCLEQGVVESPLDADIGARLGWHFPEHLGGPFGLIDTVGVQDFTAQCRELARHHGERFEPPALLVERAQRNAPFHVT